MCVLMCVAGCCVLFCVGICVAVLLMCGGCGWCVIECVMKYVFFVDACVYVCDVDVCAVLIFGCVVLCDDAECASC